MTEKFVEFSRMPPKERFESIMHGLSVISCTIFIWNILTCRQVLAYGQSEYVRQFGISFSDKPLAIMARLIDPPTVKYGAGSQQPMVVSYF